MTSTEPAVETEELSERVIGIIGGYRMGAELNAQDLFTKTCPRGSLAGAGVLAPVGNKH